MPPVAGMRSCGWHRPRRVRQNCSGRCGKARLSSQAATDYLSIMPTLIAGALAVFVLYTLLQMFRSANPALLARGIKLAGGVLALAVAAFTGIKGELAVAIPLGIFGAGLLGWAPFGTAGFSSIGGMFGGGTKSSGQTS